MKELIVTNEILIDAPVSKVWEVLIAPKFIRQWDALPDDFGDYYLESGREIDWSGTSKITVTEMVPSERLKLSFYLAKWDVPPSGCTTAYTYTLAEVDGRTNLKLEIGDFAQLAEGEHFYEVYTDFAEKALKKISLLAENKA
jgi:uncharacterized protein YndB with AHSA1/START domain